MLLLIDFNNEIKAGELKKTEELSNNIKNKISIYNKLTFKFEFLLKNF
jgi:hypothetical protein